MDSMDLETLEEHGEHIKNLRDSLDYLDGRKRDVLEALIDFAESRFLFVSNGEPVDLWGFGETPIIFLSLDETSYWVYLHNLPDIVGIDIEELVTIYHSWEESPEYSKHVGEITMGDVTTEIVEAAFVFYLFANYSVWKEEFIKNLSDLLVIVYEENGVGNNIDVAPVVEDEDGTIYVDKDSSMTLSEYVEREGLPDVDEAVNKAFRGPLGGLEEL